MNRLQGKTALITGGASGIGAGMVRCFVDEGARVVFSDVDEPGGRRLAAETGARFLWQDVADEAGWSDVMAAIADDAGHLDILVNNAGVVSHQAIDAIDLATWHRVLGINLTGMMLGCRSAVAHMRQSGDARGGSIINIGSTTSFLGLADDAIYTTSKAAVVGLTRSVATWCAREKLAIRCNSLHPGATRTPILQRQIDEHPALADVFAGMSPTGRLADVDEIARMALFLASDDSSYATGAQFVVDGGITAAHPSM